MTPASRQRRSWRCVVTHVAVVACLGGLWTFAPADPLCAASDGDSRTGARVAILLYHRFAPATAGAMTVRTATFRAQLEYLSQHGHPVVPLRMVVDWLRGRGPDPPPRSVCITVDDGHVSVYREMLPAVREYGVPVTLFIYPSAISNASYAMTWTELQALKASGLFDIESHTFWHPRFDIERRKMSPTDWDAFVMMQLTRPREVIGRRTGMVPHLLAWPFGKYDDDLMGLAAEAGYLAAFTMDRRVLTRNDQVMALPRILISDTDLGRRFASVLPGE